MAILVVSLASLTVGYLMCYVAHIDKIKAGSEIISNRSRRS